jgi:hypothetical protein
MTSISRVRNEKNLSKESGPLHTMRRPFFFCILFLEISCAQSTKHDWLIEPGVRVGPITRTSSEADLRKSFGPEAVKAKDIEIGEGQTEPGTVIYETAPDKTLAVLWKDKSRTHPDRVMICNGDSSAKCVWRTADGIGIGTTLKELEQRNGKPFELMGFNWDYAGNIMSWNDGKMKGFGLSMMVNPSPDAEDALTEEEKMAVMGEQAIQSNHPVVQKLNPTVTSLTLIFP